MSAETRKQPQLENLPKRTSDIFKYYSVPNEVAFLNRVASEGLSQRDANIYIQENVERFLGEFAGQVPYTRLSYLQKDGALTYAGIDLTDSYRKSARNSEREFDECMGYEKIQEGFANGAHTAIWISPPKIADYGFVFYFQRDPERPDHIREYILRYDEKQGELVASQKILDRLNPLESHQTDRGYLQQPHIYYDQDGNHPTLQTILVSVGIDEGAIRDSKKFEERTRAELSGWINQYAEFVSHGNVEEAKQTLRSLYNRACEIKTEINEGNEENWSIDPLPVEAGLMQHYAKKENKVVQGSCPASSNGFADPFSPASVSEQLGLGKTINGINSETQNFECVCGEESPNPLPRNEAGEAYCPHCKITPREAVQKGYAVCA